MHRRIETETGEKDLATSAGRILRVQQDGIATVTIANPGKRNALTVGMWESLRQAFLDLAHDQQLRCVVVEGASGEGFAAGADISEFETVRSTRDQVEHFHETTVWGALSAIHACPIPVVASIEGACVGGGLEIASVCDLRIAGRSAQFGVPVNMLGFPLAPAEMEWLYRLVGPAVTAELVFEGAILGAEEAFAKGLLTRVVEDGVVATAAMSCARRIARGAPLAARANKRQLRHLMESGTFTRDQRLGSYAFADTEDYRIGVQAFRDKVPPVFKGR
jgi:enoyl-CoA hydratase/carnithine racemase